MDAEVILTDHAIMRARERCRWNESTMRKMATKARTEGLGLNSVSGKLHRFLYKLTKDHNNEVLIYGEHIFVFAQNVTITVMQLDAQFRGTVRKILSKKS